MEHIVVNDQQARLISNATGIIEIRDADGTCLGYVAHGFTEDDIAIARQRSESDEPRFTTAEVLEHLRSLDGERTATRSYGTKAHWVNWLRFGPARKTETPSRRLRELST